MAEVLQNDAPSEEFLTAPSGGYDNGELVQVAGGRPGFVQAMTPPAQGDLSTIKTMGKITVTADTPAWSKGDEIWWDDSASKAVKKSNALDGAADFYLGLAAEDKALNATSGLVLMGIPPVGLNPIAFEFDCETGVGDTADHILIPAYMNPRGLILWEVFGRVTEVFAGSSQDQGIVTIEDIDNNSICTITPSDAGADVVGDVVVGHDGSDLATGGALKLVAAGKAVTGRVSQQTSGGTPAGKMTVHFLAIPLI